MIGKDLILATICINAICIKNLTTNTIYEKENNKNIFNIDQIKTKKFKNSNSKILNGKHLRIVTLEDYPQSYTELINGTRIGKGVAFEIINFLAEKFNFTYEVFVPKHNFIGSTKEIEGSIIEILYKKEADIAAAFIPILFELRQFIYFSSTILDEGEWIMIMQRPAESATGSDLLAPFQTDVWLLIFISLSILGPIIYLMIITRNKLTKNNFQKKYKLKDCIWFVYGALMKQGSTLSPIADSTRVLFATWWIFITILTSFYTANLTAFLTLSKFTLPFKDINDILRKEKHLIASRGRTIEYAIKNEGETLNILSKMVQKGYVVFTSNLNDTQTLISYVEKNNYVFITNRAAARHLLYSDYRYRKTMSMTNEKSQCPFAVSRKSVYKKQRTFGYPLNSSFHKIFDQELLHIYESGIIQYLLEGNLPEAEICPQDLGGTERQLRNTDLIMTYSIMIAGFSLATIIVFIEIIFYYIKQRKISEIQKWNNFKAKNSKGFTIDSPTPPPSYASLFQQNKIFHLRKSQKIIKEIINGRDYIVYEGENGEKQLVPVRVPSAALYQINYIN